MFFQLFLSSILFLFGFSFYLPIFFSFCINLGFSNSKFKSFFFLHSLIYLQVLLLMLLFLYPYQLYLLNFLICVWYFFIYFVLILHFISTWYVFFEWFAVELIRMEAELLRVISFTLFQLSVAYSFEVFYTLIKILRRYLGKLFLNHKWFCKYLAETNR